MKKVWVVMSWARTGKITQKQWICVWYPLMVASRENMVPDYAEAVLEINGDAKVNGIEPWGVNVERRDNLLIIKAVGKAVHASIPEQGDNAITKLMVFSC